MYKNYQTNSQAWNEVISTIKERERRAKICLEMFNQENLIGLTNEQKELFWKSI
jgi:predicted flavoprotein YhiN